MRERLRKFLEQIGSKLWFQWQQKAPIDLSTYSRLVFIRSFLYLQVTRTCIKSRTSSNMGQIGPLITELAALEIIPIDLQWENGVSMLAHSFLTESSSKLLVTRTGMKARMSSISGLWFPWPIYMLFFF